MAKLFTADKNGGHKSYSVIEQLHNRHFALKNTIEIEAASRQSLLQKQHIIDAKKGVYSLAMLSTIPKFRPIKRDSLKPYTIVSSFSTIRGKRFLLGMIYHYTWVMVYSISLLRFQKNQALRWRLLQMSCLLQSSKTQRMENLDIIHTTSIGTRDCFLKHGKTLHLQMLKSRGHFEIMIQVYMQSLILVHNAKIGGLSIAIG